MVVIGITGEIAAGKSFIIEFLQNMGMAVFNSDKVVSNLYQDHIIKEKLFNLLGIKGDDLKSIIKKEIKSDPGFITKIEDIIHPFFEEELKKFLLANKNSDIFLEIPLLYESGFNKYCDAVILVTAVQEKRYQRLKIRGNFDLDLLKIMEDRLQSLDSKKEKADYVLDSSETIEQLKDQLLTILKDEQII